MKKMDYVFAIVIVLISFAIWVGTFAFMKSGSYVRVWHEDELIAQYDLSRNGEYIISVSDNEYNILSIKGGSAVIIEANCPDKICAGQRAISKNGETIICLPHKLVFQVVGIDKDETGIDAITN